MADPRYRPYRIAVISVFIAVTGILAALFLVSVIRTLGAQAEQDAQPEADPIPAYTSPLTDSSARACLRRLEGLHRSLSDRFFSLGTLASEHGREGVRTWQTFSARWERRLEQVTDRCHLDAGGADPRAQRLAGLAPQLEELHRAYSAQVSRFLAEDGDTVKATEAAFKEARRALDAQDR